LTAKDTVEKAMEVCPATSQKTRSEAAAK
jgi:hypothetical protein